MLVQCNVPFLQSPFHLLTEIVSVRQIPLGRLPFAQDRQRASFDFPLLKAR